MILMTFKNLFQIHLPGLKKIREILVRNPKAILNSHNMDWLEHEELENNILLSLQGRL